jgi:hypothetical protein
MLEQPLLDAVHLVLVGEEPELPCIRLGRELVGDEPRSPCVRKLEILALWMS